MHSMIPYTYDESLSPSSIRLARLLPQSSPESIHISLQVADLGTNPAYDALSYTWGRPCTIFSKAELRDAPPEQALTIVCDGKELLVSKNLHDYPQVWLVMAQITWEGADERVQLAREKGMNPPGALWIDAICINQNDLVEKNSQVGMMGRIYSQSQRIIVWLGPEDQFVRPALTLLFQLLSVSVSEASELRHLRDDDKCKAIGVPSVNSSAFWAVYAFLNRSWFTRAWIVQELALAPKLHVQCGMLSFNWPSLSQACRILRETRLDEALDGTALLEIEGSKFLEPHFYEDMMPIIRTEERPDSERNLFSSRKGHANNSSSFVVSLETIRLSCAIHLRPDFKDVLQDPLYLKRGNGVPMFELLDEARETDCFDPKDKVYAFLEVGKQPYYQARVPSIARRELVADYRLSTAEVYLQAAWYLLLSGDHLNLLSIAYNSKEEKDRIPGLPSWVPDWSCRRTHTPMTGLHAFMESKWSAAGQTTWSAPGEDKLYKSVLSVQGSLIDTICAVAEDAGDYLVSKSGVVAAGLPREYPWVSPPQLSGEVLWRTLIADSTETQHPAPDFSVLFYNDVWLDAMSRAAREQFQSLEKEEEWRRFIRSHSPLFRSVADSLKRTETSSGEGPSSAVLVVAPVATSGRVLDLITQSAIDHLKRSLPSSTSPPKSQLEVAMSLLTEGTESPPSQDIDKYGRAETAVDSVEDVDADSGVTWDEDNQSIGEVSPAIDTIPEKDALELEFRRLMTRFARKRRVFRTDKHYLGNGVEDTRAGDEVWLLAGARVPMILRPLKTGMFKLVGDAYVHGLMHGEGWSGGGGGLKELEVE